MASVSKTRCVRSCEGLGEVVYIITMPAGVFLKQILLPCSTICAILTLGSTNWRQWCFCSTRCGVTNIGAFNLQGWTVFLLFLHHSILLLLGMWLEGEDRCASIPPRSAYKTKSWPHSRYCILQDLAIGFFTVARSYLRCSYLLWS